MSTLISEMSIWVDLHISDVTSEYFIRQFMMATNDWNSFFDFGSGISLSACSLHDSDLPHT